MGVLRRAAYRTTALAFGLVLAACASRYDADALSDLLLVDADGETTPYLQAIRGQRDVGAAAEPLPLGRVWVGLLGEETRWLAAYDFNRNEVVDRAEITQAWLIRSAQLSTGRAYAPDALRRSGDIAVPVRGLYLSQQEQRVLRAALDESQSGSALVASVRDVIARARGGGDDESMEDK